jgi:Hg(II)-responsive transcriptional regulator
MVGMKIGEVAARAGVNPQTLRYYERRGLLREPDRSQSGYRSYSPDAVRVVRFVKHAQELGFTLSDIDELLQLAAGEPGTCRAVRALAKTKLAELDRKIAMLRAMRRSLERLVKTCDRPRAQRECPLLQAIEGPQ